MQCRAFSLRSSERRWTDRYAQAFTRPSSPAPPPYTESDPATEVNTYPVAIDDQLQVWELYGNLGWPARYLFDQRGMLLDYHYGEGGYEETELAIQELLGSDRPVLAPLRPEEAPDARLEPEADDVEGPYSGPYTAGAVWAVLDGSGTVEANGREISVDHPGAYELIAHERSTTAELALELGDGVTCYAVCFTPGLGD